MGHLGRWLQYWNREEFLKFTSNLPLAKREKLLENLDRYLFAQHQLMANMKNDYTDIAMHWLFGLLPFKGWGRTYQCGGVPSHVSHEGLMHSSWIHSWRFPMIHMNYVKNYYHSNIFSVMIIHYFSLAVTRWWLWPVKLSGNTFQIFTPLLVGAGWRFLYCVWSKLNYEQAFLW